MQDLIEDKEIEFDASEMPNVITTPMPKHDQGVNAIEDGDDENPDVESWIYPTTNEGLNKWTAKDFIPISFIPQ